MPKRETREKQKKGFDLYVIGTCLEILFCRLFATNTSFRRFSDLLSRDPGRSSPLVLPGRPLVRVEKR